VRDDDDFNFSRLNNFGVANSKGEIVVLMNNDMEVIDEDWLTEMVSIAIQPGIGAVGAKLLYPDSRVQHGGVILGIGGWAGHSHKGFKNNCHGYCGRLSLVSEFSAVTGACLAVKKDLYIELGGLDEKNLAVACNDVDFCLRLRERGLRNVWTPFAELFHHESVSRGYEDSPEKIARFALERAFMNKRWGRQLLVDPAYNPNLTLEAEDFSLAWPPRNNY
jgi:GT2 family glycosyltransferase